MKFRNPNNGYIEESSVPFLWCLLFGFLYFIYKRIWAHALLSLVLAVLTYGLSWLIYPFFASGVVRGQYLRNGWVMVSNDSAVTQSQNEDTSVRGVALSILVFLILVGSFLGAAIIKKTYFKDEVIKENTHQPVLVNKTEKSLWVKIDELDKRSCPNSKCGIIGLISSGDEVSVFEEKYNWVRISEYYDAECFEGKTDLIGFDSNECVASNGIVDGFVAEWVPKDHLTSIKTLQEN